jgi:hypothetical protein
MPIEYLKGDATSTYKTSGTRLIIHICNDCGGWGRGFVVSLSNKWHEPMTRYKAWYNSLCTGRIHRTGTQTRMPLGEIQVVPVKDEFGTLFVVNMIAQHNFKTKDNPVAVRYQALADCLRKLDEWIKSYRIAKGLMIRPDSIGEISIHMPRIGCGLAGGSWDKVELLVGTVLFDYDVFVYDLSKTNLPEVITEEQ